MLTACLFLERAGCRQPSASATTCSTSASGPIRCLRRWPCHSQLTPSEHPVSSAYVPFPHASWLYPNYLRAETLTQANARLVDYQATLELARHWGGGEVASADGLRFVVPIRALNGGHNPKYFGVGRGVTYYNFSRDQFTGFHGIVIPGTLRDSLFILDGLLEQQTSLRPVELMADTAGSNLIIHAPGLSARWARSTARPSACLGMEGPGSHAKS